MNRTQRRSLRSKEDLYHEVTGKRTILKEIPISELKIDESKLDKQLLDKLNTFEKIKDSLERDVSRICSLMLSYLDSLCTLEFNKLGSDERENAIGIIDLVNNVTKATLDGNVLSDPDEVVGRLKDVAKFSLTCFKDTDMPMLLPLCDIAGKLIAYYYVIGGRIGAYLGYHSSVDKFTKKDVEYIKEYSDFMINKSLEIKAKN
ncbi:MAG: hypothetical protein ACYDG2_21145 [Ruminiclostridium sp.]